MCEAYTKTGKQCKMKPLKNSAFCFSHDPSNKAKHIQATSLGGSIKQSARLKPITLKSPSDALDLINDTINRIRYADKDGAVHIQTARAVALLVGKWSELYKFTELESRIANLESTLVAQGVTEDGIEEVSLSEALLSSQRAKNNV